MIAAVSPAWRRLVFAIMGFGLVVGLSIGTVGDAVAASVVDCRQSLTQLRAHTLEMVNQQRAEAGVGPVAGSVGLDDIAQDWSQTMASTGEFRHRTSFWEVYPSEFVSGGENIHKVSDGHAAAAVANHGFLHSPPHLDNMTAAGWTHVGLGFACTGSGWLYTTQNFAVSRSAPASLAPTVEKKDQANACPVELATPNPYTDVLPSGHGQSVLCLTAWGVFEPSGRSDQVFALSDGWRPGDATTRAGFADALYRLLERSGHAPRASGGATFEDVPADHPQAEAIEALAAAGVIQGRTETRFEPDTEVSRAQMASLVVRAHDQLFDQTWPLGPGFTDTAGSVHEDNIRRFVAVGITLGYDDDTYRPDQPMTRGQMATFLARYADLLVADGYTQVPTPGG